MTDLAVIVLTKDESIHIERCLGRLRPLMPRQVFVVDCYSSDDTVVKAKGLGAEVIQHPWPGLYATQFNWALDNLPIASQWVLRLDADEYLTESTIVALRAKLGDVSGDVSGLTLELRRKFLGREVRHGTNGIRLLRLFRFSYGRCEERAMDEHIQLLKGNALDFDGAFYDDNLNDFVWWKNKHLGYAMREARDAIAFEKGEVHFKKSKEAYYKTLPYLRAFIYFCLRYFIKGGFLDGYAGWQWNFWQGLWYRWLVDREISRLKSGR